jgi:single-stranded-DNA-specific exonuclease
MLHTHKILNIAAPNLGLQETLSKELAISKIFAQILINRGLETPGQAKEFLGAKLDSLLDPYLLQDMDKAVCLIKKAKENKEKIMVFGDYDVDGLTALSLLKSTLSKIGMDVGHYLPHRVREGYGLNKNITQIAKQKNIKMLITVDCGTNSQDTIEELRRQGIEVIITDHHEPLDYQAKNFASAMVNPKMNNPRYSYRDLAGVGVAYKLCQAITGSSLFEELDLVSLGTIADVVPLTGENRVIAKEGLIRLTHTKKIGLRALMESSGISNKKINTTFVSFILGPRINASGRMDTAEVALALLLSQKEEEAKELAESMETHNRQRQKIESKILEEAQDLIDREINFKEHKVVVLAKEDWHPGVLGIVASKLAERFYRPTIIISLNERLCKGSGRSVKNFHLFQALVECKDLLENFGGHSHAVGLVVAKERIEDFKSAINRLAKEKLLAEDLIPHLDIDVSVALSDLNTGIIEELEDLQPFGADNPEPLFYTSGLKLKGAPQVLGKNTLKFWVTDGKATYQTVGFGFSYLKDSLIVADSFDLVYTPRIDDWQGEGNICLELKDIILGR